VEENIHQLPDRNHFNKADMYSPFNQSNAQTLRASRSKNAGYGVVFPLSFDQVTLRPNPPEVVKIFSWERRARNKGCLKVLDMVNGRKSPPRTAACREVRCMNIQRDNTGRLSCAQKKQEGGRETMLFSSWSRFKKKFKLRIDDVDEWN